MADVPQSPPQRLVRYRSQRRAQGAAVPDHAPPVPTPPPSDPAAPDDEGVARSRSRYHRKNAASTQRPVTAHSTSQRTQRTQSSGGDTYSARHASPPGPRMAPDWPYVPDDGYGPEAVSDARRHQPPGGRGVPHSREPTPPRQYRQSPPSSPPAEPHPPPHPPYAAAAASLPGLQPSGELFPPPRPGPAKPVTKALRVDGPPTSDQIRATKSTSQLPRYSDDDGDDDNDEDGGCFGLFKRKRSRSKAPSAASEKEPAAQPVPTSHGPPAIKAGGGGVVPGTDAPVSAVNAGDRHVLVECGQSRTIFPVTPTTTPVDIIKSAANCMSERIDVHGAVLLESFESVGVQRPLRRYEHVRDAMNSWDTDQQNSLLLVHPATGASDIALSMAGVPPEKPGDVSWLLLYSRKVGKWDKRFITLKSDGQVTLQKDPSKPQHQENVCHLSDFDIYTPTPEQLRKKIKPPKKICFAVKSQQKTSMFESTQNFVHFFCTHDRATADDFYRAVQGWRSWYLVNVLGEGRKPKPAEAGTGAGAADHDAGAGAGAARQGHRAVESFDSHYQLGSFKPLIDMDQFDERQETAKSANVGGFIASASPPDAPVRRTSTRRRKPYPPGAMADMAQLAEDEPLANFGRRASGDQRRPSTDHSRPEEFASTGLLGRSYSQRQRELAEREKQSPKPFTAGPSLLHGAYDAGPDEYGPRPSQDGLHRTHSSRMKPTRRSGSHELRRNPSARARGSTDLQRSSSKRGPHEMMPKPLVDLTPQYREPAQHVKKGRGHHPDMPGALVESATSPEDPLGIPPSTDWRGRPAPGAAGLHASDSRAGARPITRGRRPTTSRSPDDANGAFTGEGLLASGSRGWSGAERSRRGVSEGAHARGPLLDVNEPSRFVQGSLLNRVERDLGRDGPIIDREKRVEREEKYGEGF